MGLIPVLVDSGYDARRGLYSCGSTGEKERWEQGRDRGRGPCRCCCCCLERRGACGRCKSRCELQAGDDVNATICILASRVLKLEILQQRKGTAKAGRQAGAGWHRRGGGIQATKKVTAFIFPPLSLLIFFSYLIFIFPFFIGMIIVSVACRECVFGCRVHSCVLEPVVFFVLLVLRGLCVPYFSV